MTPPRPPRSTVNVDAIPSPLKARPQWAAFRYGLRDGAWTKIPKQPNGQNAKSDDPTTWSSFEAALDAFEADPTLDGIGYIFAEDDPFCGVDIDKVKRDPDRLAWALRIIRRLGTYAEWSVSGSGLHAIGKGKMPDADGMPQKGRNDQAKGLEAYSRRRFFTFTGTVVEASSTAIVDVQEHLDWLLANEFKPRNADRPPSRPTAGPIATTERIERIKARMFDGPRGGQLRRLDAGDGSDYRKADGSIDWSSADLSFCSGAWYYADGDEAIVETIWLTSGLASARPNGSKLDRADYRQSTIRQAAGSKTYRDTHGYSAWEDPPRIQFKPKPPEPKAIGNDGGTTCPSDQPATLEDALVLIAQLRQENAELSQSNVDLLGWVDRTAGFVEELQTINGGLRRDVDQLREQIAGWKTILSNPKLKPADRIVAIPIVDQVRHARLNGQDEIHIRYPGIVNGWGIPESTVQKSVAVVTDMVGAPLAKRNEPDKPVLVETKHGPKEVTPWKTIVSATVEGDLYAAVGSYDPGLPQRGGTRTPLPTCKDHPEADVIVRAVTQCATCRKPIAPAREQTIRRQNEGVNNPHPPAVDDSGTYCRQNDSVTGHDGAEQSERASKVIPIDTRPGRLRRQDAGLGRIRMTRPPTQEVPAPPGCTRMGCDEPAANGFVCAGHLRGDPMAMMGAET